MRSVVEPCLLAGMLGDAWGGAYEGTSGVADAPFPRVPAISDDTQLVIATAEAILERDGSVSAEAIAASFRRWFESGRMLGLGSSTLKALRDLSAGAHWALAGARGEFAAGSGAAMRAAPLAFLLNPDSESDRRLIHDVARITHHNDEAYAGALAVIAAIRVVAAGGDRRDLLSPVESTLPDTAVRDRIRELARPTEPVAPGSSGHAVDAVPTALWLATQHNTIPDVIKAAIRLGGDTDTIASIAAQVLGASGAPVPRDLAARIPDAAEARATFRMLAGLVPR